MAKKNLQQIKEKGEKLWEEVDRVMDLIEKTSDKVELNESSLSRAWRYTEEYDIAIISASRAKEENCIDNKHGKEEGEEYTKEENLQRRQDLVALLITRGYGTTAVDGSYIENFGEANATEVKEDATFVVNWNHDEDFFDKIFRLGRYFCQDSVLIKKKGEKEAYLVGTNNASFPGYNQRVSVGEFKGGKEDMFMTRVGKSRRPFTFSEDCNVMTRGVMARRAKTLLEQMGEEL